MANTGLDECYNDITRLVVAVIIAPLFLFQVYYHRRPKELTVAEGSPQTICQNLDNLKPENGSNSIESHIFTFEAVPVNASFHSCIQRLISPNITLCDNYWSKNSNGPTIEQIRLPFFGVDPAYAQDDEGYIICPENLTEVQCYGKIVRTPDDGYDVNDTSIDQANKSMSTVGVSLRQQEPNQIHPSKEPYGVYYEGLDWWGICNNSLIRSYISQPCETLVTPDHHALTSEGKVVLEKVLCPKGPSVLSTIELFYGSIPDKVKNKLNIACGWH